MSLLNIFLIGLRMHQTRFENFNTTPLSQEEIDQIGTANQSLCEYSNKYSLAEGSKTICDSVTQIHILLEEIISIHSDEPIERWREELSALSAEITTLQQQIIEKARKNNEMRTQLEAQVEEYTRQAPEREEQYRLFSKQLTNESNEKLQQIYKAYQLKGELLEKEYELLHYILYQLRWEKTDMFFSKRDDFLNALAEFISNIPEHVIGFFRKLYATK